MKLRLIVGLTFSLLFPSVALATPLPANLASLFAEGNALYQNGDYASAEKIYRRLLEAGVDSGTLDYNLGNVCFKQKKLGEAIYYWGKAQEKLPRDRDVRENLELANLLVVDRIEAPANPWPIRLLDSTVHLWTIQQESWLVLFLFIGTNLLLSIYVLAKTRRATLVGLFGSLVAAGLLILSLSSLGWKIYEQRNRQEGIIVEQRVDIRSGPGNDNITVFTVHEGIKIRVRGETAGWYQVSLANGWTGWLEKGAVRVL